MFSVSLVKASFDFQRCPDKVENCCSSGFDLSDSIPAGQAVAGPTGVLSFSFLIVNPQEYLCVYGDQRWAW